MKVLILLLICLTIAVPALAGAPVDGNYKSTDIGGLMLPGRYSELWFGGKLAVNNTLNEQSWNGALGTQWHWYCPWIVVPPTLLLNTVDGFGNGQKIWRVTYTGGYCWLDGAGPWAGGDPSYMANITVWVAIVTETYVNFVEVGSIRNHNAQGQFVGYGPQCMDLSISNVTKLGDTTGGPLPANYPDFWSWFACNNVGTGGPGEWGDVAGITFSILKCGGVAVNSATWGAVKAMYR